MKRRPTNIVANIIDVLNGLNRNSSLSYNELKQITGMHWETIRDYITLIGLIQSFAPKIEIDKKDNNVGIKEYSNSLMQLSFEDQVITILFLEKIFDQNNAVMLDHYIKSISEKEIKIIEKSEFIQKSNSIHGITYYITRKGKFKAQGILASISTKINTFIESNGKMEMAYQNNYIMLLPEKKCLATSSVPPADVNGNSNVCEVSDVSNDILDSHDHKFIMKEITMARNSISDSANTIA